MRELSLHILDIAQNSVTAGAGRIDISVTQERAKALLHVCITDDGCGMTPEQLQQVSDPFYTTRTTRKVGMGVSLFRMAAEQTGGDLHITSAVGQGTTLQACFHTGHLDCLPLGDMAGTLMTLLSMNEQVRFCFCYRVDGREFLLDSREITGLLEGVPLCDPQVALWLREYVRENMLSVAEEAPQ